MASNLYLFFIAFNVFEKCNYYKFFNVGGVKIHLFLSITGKAAILSCTVNDGCVQIHMPGPQKAAFFGHMMSLPPRLNRWCCPNSHSTSPNLPRLMRSRRRSLWGCQRTQLANFLSWTWKPHAVMSRRDWGHADEKCIRKCGLCANFSISRYHGCSG